MPPTTLQAIVARNNMSPRTPGVDPTISVDMFLQLQVEDVVIQIARENKDGKFGNENKFAGDMKRHLLDLVVTKLEGRGALQPDYHADNLRDLVTRYTGLKHDIRKANRDAGHDQSALSSHCDLLLQRAAASEQRACRLPGLPSVSAIPSSPAPHVNARSSPSRTTTPSRSAVVSHVKSKLKRKASIDVLSRKKAKRAKPRESRGPASVKKVAVTSQAPDAVHPSPPALVHPPPKRFPPWIQVRGDEVDMEGTPLWRLIGSDRILQNGSIHAGSFDALVHLAKRKLGPTYFVDAAGGKALVSDSPTLEAHLQEAGDSRHILLWARVRPTDTCMDDLGARMRESILDNDEGIPAHSASEALSSSPPIDRVVHKSPIRRSQRGKMRHVVLDDEGEDVDMGGMAEERMSQSTVVEGPPTERDMDEGHALVASLQDQPMELDEKIADDAPSTPLSSVELIKSPPVTDHDMDGSSAAPLVVSSQIRATNPDEKAAIDAPSPPLPVGEAVIPSDPPERDMDEGHALVASLQDQPMELDEKIADDAPSTPLSSVELIKSPPVTDHDMDGSSAAPLVVSSQIRATNPDEKAASDAPSPPLPVGEAVIPSDPPERDMDEGHAALPVASPQTQPMELNEKIANDAPSALLPAAEVVIPSDLPDQMLLDPSTNVAGSSPQPMDPASETRNGVGPPVQSPPADEDQPIPQDATELVRIAEQALPLANPALTCAPKTSGQRTPDRSTAHPPVTTVEVSGDSPGYEGREYTIEEYDARYTGRAQLKTAVDSIDDDDDVDDDGEMEEQARMASTVIERGQLDFALVPRFCEMMRLGAADVWDPNAPHPHALVGALVTPKSYQLLTAVMAMHEEFRWGQSCSTDRAHMSVGYGIHHEAGLGKTIVAIYKFVLRNWLLWVKTRISRSRSKKDGQHLAEDATGSAKCPSDGIGDYRKMPFRCPCEPSGLSKELWAKNGATIVVTTLSLISNFEQELYRTINFEPLSEIWGWPVVTLLGHHAASKYGSTRAHATSLQPFLTKSVPTMRDWATANDQDEDSFRLDVQRGGFGTYKTPRAKSSHPTAGLLLLTTPQSLHSFCLPLIYGNLCSEGGLRSTRQCKGLAKCILTGSVKGGKVSHANSHNFMVPTVNGLRLTIAEVVVDEAHDLEQKSTSRIATLRSLFVDGVDRFGVGLVVCPMTGTPRSKSPIELLAYPTIHRSRRWPNHPDLALLANDGDEAVDVYEALYAVKVHKKLSAAHLALLLKAAGRPDAKRTTDQRQHMLATLEADSLADAAWKRVGEPVGLALLRCAVEFRAADTYKHRPFVVLPAFTTKVHMLTLSERQAAIIAPLIPQYTEALLRRREAEKAEKAKQVSSSGVALTQEVKGILRYMEVCINIPYLHTVFRGDRTNLLAGTVLTERWFQNVRSSPWWVKVDMMYESSPKLQRFVRRARNLPFVDADPAGDPALIGQKVRDSYIIFAYEPILALMAYATILRKCPERNCEAIYRCANATDKTDRQEVLARFKHQPSPRAAAEGRVEYGAPVHVLVVCTKIGGTGLTLTQSNTVDHFDVDPDAARHVQVPKRVHRITQTRDVTCTQFLMDYCGLEEWRHKRVRKGVQVANCLPDLGSLTIDGRGTIVSTADAITSELHSPGNSRQDAIVLDE